jgi:hypothetical protein
MTDWKKIAEAQGLKLADADLAIAVSRLSTLEERLAALISTLSPEENPFEPEAGQV